MLDPYKLAAAAPHMTITTHRLDDGTKGLWFPDHDTIVLDDRLTQAERRCTLMHELVHRARRDDPCLPPHLAEKQERACRERTARLLIRLDDLIDALLWDQQPRALADALWVDEETLQDRLSTLRPDEQDYIERRLWAAEQEIA